MAILGSVFRCKTKLAMSDLVKIEFLDTARRTVARRSKMTPDLSDIDTKIRQHEAQFIGMISLLAQRRKISMTMHPDTVRGYHSRIFSLQKSFEPETIRRGTMLKSGVPESRDMGHMYQAIHAGATVLYTWDQRFAMLAEIAKKHGLHIHVLHEDEKIKWPWDLEKQNDS